MLCVQVTIVLMAASIPKELVNNENKFKKFTR
jgi:hypothetical protein